MADEKPILVKPENEEPRKWNKILLFGGIGIVLLALVATIGFSGSDETSKKDTKSSTVSSQQKESKLGDQTFSDPIKAELASEEKQKQEDSKKGIHSNSSEMNSINHSPAPTYVEPVKSLSPEEKYAQEKRQRELDRQEKAVVQRENQDIEAQRSGIFVNLPQVKEEQYTNQLTNETVNDYYNNSSNNNYIQVVGNTNYLNRQGGYQR